MNEELWEETIAIKRSIRETARALRGEMGDAFNKLAERLLDLEDRIARLEQALAQKEAAEATAAN